MYVRTYTPSPTKLHNVFISVTILYQTNMIARPFTTPNRTLAIKMNAIKRIMCSVLLFMCSYYQWEKQTVELKLNSAYSTEYEPPHNATNPVAFHPYEDIEMLLHVN